MLRTTYIYIGVGVLMLGAVVYFFITFLFPSTPTTPSTTTETNLGVSDIRTNVGASSDTTSGTNTQTPISSQTSSQQKVFKIADGPISGAVFLETKNPTTTVARYGLSNNGHVLDVAIDVPGAVAKSVSNTTIPGALRAQWGTQGSVAVLQYVESSTIKTVALTFPPQSTSTVALPVRLQFFPNGITDITLSPDGKQAAYLLRTAAGVDGYIAKSDGSGGKKLFSLPLSQVLISWSAQPTLLLYTKSTNNAPGMIFSVDVASGNVLPLLYAQGVTASADPSFSYVVYQSTASDGKKRTSYVHNVRTGDERELSFTPIPEKCIWSSVATSSLMYCATPLLPTAVNYLDEWHIGTASMADTLFSFNVATGASKILATPGGNEGGEASDIASIAVSPNGKYLLFIKKGDRSLWGVRLTQ